MFHLPRHFSLPLETLRLSYTKVQVLEQEVGNLANLAELDISHTAIANLPLDIGKLTNLQQLKLEVRLFYLDSASFRYMLFILFSTKYKQRVSKCSGCDEQSCLPTLIRNFTIICHNTDNS